MIAAENLSKRYGEQTLFESISFKINRKERVGLVGRNGHGKTTLLRSISGLLRPWAGSIKFEDRDITRSSPRQIVGMGLIHVPQASTLFPRMTVLENLTLGAYAPRARLHRRRNLERVFALFPRLADRRAQLCQTLSGGERQMTAIGIGLMGEPAMLMLDEPTLGLAPLMKEVLAGAIKEIAGSGVTLLMVDQDINLLLDVCQREYLLEGGKTSLELYEGERVREEQVLEIYFGSAGASRGTIDDA
jgi:ABC-type branched-chain amino acid transport systems, ATPase component